MNDLAQRVVNAMIRQEGMPTDHANPMNLRAAPWLQNPATFSGFWVPGSRAEGVAGGAHVFALHVAQGNSLTDFIAGHPGVYAGFAPGADGNDPESYIRNVQAWAEIDDATVPLWNYLGEAICSE